MFKRVLGRIGNSKRRWHLIQRQSILDYEQARKILSHARFRRQFQPDSTQPRGMGSAKTPENVSTDFSLMVIGSFSVQPKFHNTNQEFDFRTCISEVSELSLPLSQCSFTINPTNAAPQISHVELSRAGVSGKGASPRPWRGRPLAELPN